MRRVQPLRPRAPALGAAVCLGLGVFLGAASVRGTGEAAVGAGLAALGCFLAAGARRRAVFGALLFLFAGFGIGLVRLSVPSRRAFDAFCGVDHSLPVEVRGRLIDFWSGKRPLRRSRLRAESLVQAGRRLRFEAPVLVWLSGDLEPQADRGDFVTLAGEIRRQDIPASARDLPGAEQVYSLSVKSALQIRGAQRTPASRLYRPNRILAEKLEATSLPEAAVQGPVAALLLGRTGALDRGLLRNFRRGGLSHLLVVSGLHVALIAAGLELLFAALRLRPRARDAAVLAAVAGFALFTGGALPVLRAALTLAVLLLARILEKPVAVLQAAGLSAIAVLALHPEDLFTAGFFLTYAAAAGIALLTGPAVRALARVPRVLRLPIAVTLSAQLATAPIVFWRFNLVAGLSWIAAPLCLPLLAFLLADGAAILLFLAIGLPPALPGRLFGMAEKALEAIAERSGAGGFLRPTPPLVAVLGLLILLAVAALRPGRARIAALFGYAALFLALALRGMTPARAGEFTVEALDVGQGDAILLRSGGGAFLIDGGGTWDLEDEDFGRTRLLPKLLDRGITRLDGVLLSHPHPDHALGLFAVLGELPVSDYFRGDGPDDSGYFDRLDRLAQRRGARIHRLKSGEDFSWRGGELRVVRAGGRLFKKDPVNNDSVVVAFAKGGRRALFTGDAGFPAEREILDGALFPGPVDILKVGHHGSRTSSSPEFLRAVAPRAALLSCGRENRFHHPAPQTLESFSRARVPLFRTDLRSDVGFAVTPDHLLLFQRGIP